MFKFDEYPEIKKAYREYTRLNRILDKEERKIQPSDDDSRLSAQKAFDKLEAFSDVFSLLIYNTFKCKKPKLYSQVKNCFAKWDKVFPDNWEDFNEGQKYELLSLVLEIGYGQYWLPDEYYDEKSRYEGVKWPQCHTKPFKCW